MNIVITGSTGHISKPLTQQLIQQGHAVTVVSSRQERKQEIEAMGAKPAIGTMEDVDFLTRTYRGADIVYLMESIGSASFFDHTIDFIASNIQLGRNHKEAIANAGVTQVVHLSSIGAHMPEGNGILAFHHSVESLLNELPPEVSIKFIRPVGFFYNMYAFIPTIKAIGAIVQNYGGDEKEPWVSPVDIAAVIAEAMNTPFDGREVRYVASEELSPNEVARILGEAIGKPDLHWMSIPDEDMLANLIKAGMNPKTANGVVEMNASRRGRLYEDYQRHRPALGPTKLRDFATDFAAAYDNR